VTEHQPRVEDDHVAQQRVSPGKTYCAQCYNWISWSRAEGRWYHLATGVPECRFADTIATRSAYLPLVDLIDADRKLIRP